jgi:signal transduction histidine kinase
VSHGRGGHHPWRGGDPRDPARAHRFQFCACGRRRVRATIAAGVHVEDGTTGSPRAWADGGPPRALRVLLVEASDEDAAQVERALRRALGPLELARVETPEAFEAALGAPRDVVVCGDGAPRLSPSAALEALSRRGLDLPLVVVSGTAGEAAAVAAIKAGASEYVTRSDLARLAPAVEGEVREAAARRARATRIHGAEQRMATLLDEVRRIEAQLVVSDRLVSVGTLAAGIAHEINNPLACVLTNLSLAASDLAALAAAGKLDPEILAEVEDAEAAAQRVRAIAQDLRVFSHGDDERVGPVDVEGVVESAVRMARNEVKHRATVEKRFARVPWVWGNEARLGQVFLNLVLNAAQAIPEGAADRNRIVVETSLAEDGTVRVDVSDTGCGMTPEVLRRVFTPFFTTKPTGTGSGLGLAISRRIVDALGGAISIESAPGRGTVVHVFLPRAEDRQERAPAPADPGARTSRRGRVLVVDDDALVRVAVRRVLSSRHDVFEAEAPDALARLRAGERFDVVLCDILMPVVTGMDLHRAVAEAAPDQAARFVFMTAGAFTPTARAFLATSGLRLLAKPFDPAELREAVDRLVG